MPAGFHPDEGLPGVASEYSSSAESPTRRRTTNRLPCLAFVRCLIKRGELCLHHLLLASRRPELQGLIDNLGPVSPLVGLHERIDDLEEGRVNRHADFDPAHATDSSKIGRNGRAYSTVLELSGCLTAAGPQCVETSVASMNPPRPRGLVGRAVVGDRHRVVGLVQSSVAAGDPAIPFLHELPPGG